MHSGVNRGERDGEKKLLGLEAGFRESELTWKSLLLRLVDQGLQTAPKLAVGDGALGFWKVLAQVFPAKHWAHVTIVSIPSVPRPLRRLTLQLTGDSKIETYRLSG
jgi:transposase-like protein